MYPTYHQLDVPDLLKCQICQKIRIIPLMRAISVVHRYKCRISSFCVWALRINFFYLLFIVELGTTAAAAVDLWVHRLLFAEYF